MLKVEVQDIDAVNLSTNTQTATIKVAGVLADENVDNQWFGLVTYTLICLGRHP